MKLDKPPVLGTLVKVPAGQGVGAVELWRQKLPRGQSVQLAAAGRSVSALYVPEGHGLVTGLLEDSGQKKPAVQGPSMTF